MYPDNNNKLRSDYWVNFHANGGNAPSWSSSTSLHFRSLSSQVNSYGSYVTLEDEPDASPYSYSNLWEIQLKLGEIPDMISHNLLEPCASPSFKTEAHCETPCSFPFRNQAEAFFCKRIDGYNKEEARRERVFTESAKQNDHDMICFLELDDNPSIGVDKNYGAMKAYEEEEDKENGNVKRRWDTSMIRPVYVIGRPMKVRLDDKTRHDRKDSGFLSEDDVFFCKEKHILSVTVSDPGSSAAATSITLKTKQDRKHGHSVAFASLQRIASRFICRS